MRATGTSSEEQQCGGGDTVLLCDGLFIRQEQTETCRRNPGPRPPAAFVRIGDTQSDGMESRA